MPHTFVLLLRCAVIAGLVAVRSNALGAPPTAGSSAADRLADSLVEHQETSNSAGALTMKAPPKDRDKSTTVSVLDVAAKLALLVLAVYGIAYGLRIAQRSGLCLGSAMRSADARRLKAIEELPLRAGVALHLVEVDGQSLVVATAPGGMVSVVMEAGSAATAETEPAPAPQPQTELSGGMSILRNDADWQARRDALIRALSSQTT